MSGSEKCSETEPGLLESRKVHRGRIVDLSIDTVRFPDGSTGELEMIRHPGAAAVVPLLDPVDSDDPRVLMIHQYRYASGGYLFEVPAGLPDSSEESWEECARRELEEETGMTAGKIERLTGFFTTPGFTDEVIHIFLATDLTEGSHQRDADEFISLVRMPFSEALQKIRDGDITDAKTICALLYVSSFCL